MDSVGKVRGGHNFVPLGKAKKFSGAEKGLSVKDTFQRGDRQDVDLKLDRSIRQLRAEEQRGSASCKDMLGVGAIALGSMAAILVGPGPLGAAFALGGLLVGLALAGK